MRRNEEHLPESRARAAQDERKSRMFVLIVSSIVLWHVAVTGMVIAKAMTMPPAPQVAASG